LSYAVFQNVIAAGSCQSYIVTSLVPMLPVYIDKAGCVQG